MLHIENPSSIKKNSEIKILKKIVLKLQLLHAFLKFETIKKIGVRDVNFEI